MTDHWRHHPGVRSKDQLTIGERAADSMRAGLGTWRFLGLLGLVLLAWIVTGGFGADRSPFFILNLSLSCIAGLQGVVILLAQKRADRVASELAVHHYGEGRDIAALLQANTDLTTEVHALTVALHSHLLNVPTKES